MRRSASRNSRFPQRIASAGLIAVLLAGCSSAVPTEYRQSKGDTSGTQAGSASTADVLSAEPVRDGSEAVDDAEKASATAATPRKAREPIYNEMADARADIAAALGRAKYDHKRVLLKFGGNWCGWCWKLHDLFRKDPEIAAVLRDEYELVLIDALTNDDLQTEYKIQRAYPFLTVLDSEGGIVVNQRTAALEQGSQHDPEKVLQFLKRWQAEPLDAEQVLARALEQARSENKRVLVHLGTPTCGWCRVLNRYLLKNRDLFALDYVDARIDTVRMTQGDSLARRLRKDGPSGGVPWMTILAADGAALITSDGPGGNIGYPFQPHEIEYFMGMLRQTRRSISDAQLADLEQQLREYAAAKKTAEQAGTIRR